LLPFILVTVTRALLAIIFVYHSILSLPAQEPAKATSQKATVQKAISKAVPANDVFSGTVTASGQDSVTVVRKVPAKADEYRVFVVDKDTKIEGKLRVNARVTVRFKAGDEGSFRALRIVVRADAKVSPGRPGTSR
jgi:hypothetical protein